MPHGQDDDRKSLRSSSNITPRDEPVQWKVAKAAWWAEAAASPLVRFSRAMQTMRALKSTPVTLTDGLSLHVLPRLDPHRRANCCAIGGPFVRQVRSLQVPKCRLTDILGPLQACMTRIRGMVEV